MEPMQWLTVGSTLLLQVGLILQAERKGNFPGTMIYLGFYALTIFILKNKYGV